MTFQVGDKVTISRGGYGDRAADANKIATVEKVGGRFITLSDGSRFSLDGRKEWGNPNFTSSHVRAFQAGDDTAIWREKACNALKRVEYSEFSDEALKALIAIINAEKARIKGAI